MAPDRRIGDGERVSPLESDLLRVQLEDGGAFEEQVELLLPALSLVVLFDEQLIRVTSQEHIRAERVDAKRVLKRIPDRVVRPGVGDCGNVPDRALCPAHHSAGA
jgi:hypothetical protein